MLAALALAARGLGRVAPNPAVGCVIVAVGQVVGQVVGRGWTQPGGRPHAEAEALARAGQAARGATAYVTLEPCAHHGKTPPCADALVAAGIARCVVAAIDPDPRVNNAGLRRLAEGGISVDLGLCRAEAEEVNAGFFLVVRKRRPLVTLKLATSLDGRIACAGGDSKWITGTAARRRAHLLRAQHDAVMVGAGTAVQDDPRLDVRLPGLAAVQPLRVVLDSRLRLPETHDLVARAREHPSLIFAGPLADSARSDSLRAAGAEVMGLAAEEDGSGLSLSEALSRLAERGVTRLLVEGGGKLAAALLRADLVDRLVVFRAGKVIGGDGIPAIGDLGFARVADCPVYEVEGVVGSGEDIMESYCRKRPIAP
jgi:diaminohydroxyphosphoribosylaminopyrimidine deaminase/5-amino-6-(5-phosphoribosylamino)uracil reductase